MAAKPLTDEQVRTLLDAHRVDLSTYPDGRRFAVCSRCRWEGPSRRNNAEAHRDRVAHYNATLDAARDN